MATHKQLLLGISGQGGERRPAAGEEITDIPTEYTKYSGGNAELDALLANADAKYNAAMGNSTAMRNAMDEYNQALNAYGHSADFSRESEINSYAKSGSPGSGGGGGGGRVFGASTPSGAGGVNDYSTYIQQMHDAQKRANLSALENAYKKNVSALDRVARDIPVEYQNARNQTASQSAIQQKNFNEYAAARGLNAGTSAQAQLAFGNTLQSNLSDINQREAASLADIDLQRAQLEADYNAAIAQANAGANYELASALYNEKIRVDNALLNEKIRAENAIIQTEQNNRKLAEDRAATLAKYGDFSGYAALGYSDAEIKAMTDYFNAANAVYSAPGRSTNNPPAAKTPDWDGLYVAAYNSGNPKSYIANMYKNFDFASSSGVYDDYLNWVEAKGDKQIATQDKVGEIAKAAAGMKSSGASDGQIDDWIEALPYYLTDAQKTKILMSLYGG